MNQEIRNRLRNVVTQCRKLLEESISQELEGKYAIFAKKDHVTADPNAPMRHLTYEEQAARRDILDHFGHIKARGFKPKDALDQLVREIAFTHLNRFCAYKMMEAREVYVGGQKFREAVSRGIKSNGFLFYLGMDGHETDERLYSTGQQDVAYRRFLDWLGSLLSEEIGVLFNPNDSANRLYPRQKTLDEVLDLLNEGGIKPEETELRDAWPAIWSQDETIGWVYQYFTPKELRDQARKESAAPRNSYELAFRNQFFTPRYVVEFLTDNSLGRIWYEMCKGNTKLTDQCRYMVRRPTEIFLEEGEQPPKETGSKEQELSQEELLKLPVHIPHRPKKDPRELKILDPACGSGHFLLYCFDLLQTIYEEAYTDPKLGLELQNEYPTISELRRDVPRLILAHNVHGIDIDLRASQIAALALWLRCQRAYQEIGLRKDRPTITRSNFVCAEPMPGEEQMLKEFVGQLEPKLLGHVVEVVFDKMKLAGEAGSLLKIEEEIRGAVAAAKKQWIQETTRATDRKGQPLLFTQAALDRLAGRPEQPTLFDLSDITDDQFFEQAEANVVEALRQYAERAQNGQRLQRRLFTDDTVRGFAFVDLCQMRYDVAMMNPPFGASSELAKELIEEYYPRTKNDLYAAFVERGMRWLLPNGLLGAITSRTGFFLSSFQKWREEILLSDASPTVVTDLGSGVLDTAMVETAAYCVTAGKSTDACVFIRLLNCEDKDAGAREALKKIFVSNGTSDVFYVEPESFRQVPGSPFLYWVSDRVRHLFHQLPPLESNGRENRVGLQTSDNFRFLRCWWEVPATSLGVKWFPYAKGGGYSPYYRDLTLCVNWRNDGEEIKDFARQLGNSPSRSVRSEDHYFRSALTYSDRCTGGFATSPLPSGAIFDVKGSCIFVDGDGEQDLLRVLGVTLSNPFRKLMALRSGTHSLAQSFQVGQISSTPFPSVNSDKAERLAMLAARAYDSKREILRLSETDHTFTCVKIPKGNGFQAEARALDENLRNRVEELKRIQDELDTEVARLYSLPDPDLAQLLDVTSSAAEEKAEEDADDSEESEIASATADGLVRSLFQWAGGAIFGRWDIRQGVREARRLPGPFDKLPTCALGMLQGDDGLPVVRAPSGYPLRIDGDGILPDDADHKDDIVRGVRNVLEFVGGENAEITEIEGCAILGVKELRDYFRKPGKGGFWEYHVSHYSRSSRKAPIYWLLQSSNKNYALWLYYHRLDKDLLFKALVNYVEPKIRLETSHLDTVRKQKAAAGDTSKDGKRLAKEIESQEDFLSELRDFEDKLRRAANLHLIPDLDDGVVLNIAPLWELVPWKEAKNYWEELLNGKYEWSSIGKQLRQKGLVE